MAQFCSLCGKSARDSAKFYQGCDEVLPGLRRSSARAATKFCQGCGEVLPGLRHPFCADSIDGIDAGLGQI